MRARIAISLFVEMHAMGQHRALVEQAEMVEMADHRAAVAIGDVLDLGAGLGGMGGRTTPRSGRASLRDRCRFSGETV